VQLQALLFLSRANRYSDRPAAVADYLATTRGTVSQTLRVLEERGLIAKEPDQTDRRQVHLRVTGAGRKVVRRASRAGVLEEAVSGLGKGEAAHLDGALADLLRTLQSANGHISFGVCRTCRHFQKEGGGAFRCGLTGEPLAARESELLCREHEIPETVV